MKHQTSLAAARSRRFTVLQKLSFAVLAAGALLAASTRAADTELDVNAGATDLTSSASYTPATTPTAANDVTFAAGTTYANPSAFTINSSIAFGSLDDLNATALTISNTGGTASVLTLGGSGDSVSGSNSADLLYVATGANLTISGTGASALGLNLAQTGNLDIAGTAAISSIISGANGLTKTGVGALTLSGANTYTGGTTISAGTLSISSDGNLGSTAVANGVSLNGGTLDTGSSSVTLNANHGITVGASGGTFNSTINGNAITFGSTNTLSGSGAVLFQGNSGGNNAYVINAAQNISGAITVDNTRLNVNAGATLGTGAVTVHSNAEIFVGGTVTLANNFFLNGNNSDGRGAFRDGGNTTLNGNITLQGDSYLSGTGAVTTTLNGTTTGAFTLYLGNSGAFGGGSDGSANYVINGADSATATSINLGSLTIGTGTALQNTMLTGASGGTVKFASGVGTFFASSLAGNEAIGLTDTGGAPVTLSVGATQTYSGTLTGGAGSALTFTGTGEAHFQGTATGFTGAINVNTTGNGKLDINTSLGSGGSYNVASGATLFVYGNTIANTIINLSGGGNGEFLGALRLDGGNIDTTSTINLLTDTSIGGNGGTGTIAGVIAGAHGFNKAGGDTLVLSGANTFSGTTNLGGSTLNLSNALALQNSTLNYTGGTLVFDSSVTGNAFTLGGLSGGTSIALQNNAGTPAAIALTFGGNNSSQTFTGNLTGSGSVIKTGTGTETLGGTNSLTGGFTIGNGTVFLNNTNQPGAGTLTFGTAGAANTTVLAFSQGSRTFSNPIVTQGTGGTNTIQPQGGGQNFSFNGGITLGNNLTLTTNNGSDSISIDTGAIGGTGNLVTNVSTISAGGSTPAGQVNPSGGTISLNSAINNVGTISNVGNGTASVTINGAIGSNVTSLIQNSATSRLIYNQGNNGGTLTGTLQVLNGLDIAGGSYFTNPTGAGTVTLGTAGAANTTGITFSVFGRTFNNPIATQGTGGTNTIQAQGGGQGFTLAGGITLGNNLTLSTYAGSDSITATGNVSGTGNLVTNVSTTGIDGSTGSGTGGTITLNGGINHTGTLSNVGTGSSTVTVNGVIGTNVTGVIQNSATSPLSLSATNTYTGPTTVSAGLLTVTNTGSINGSTSVQVGSTGSLTLANSTSLSDAGTLNLVSGATLTLGDANGTTETIGNLILNGTVEPAGTYNTTTFFTLTGSSGINFMSTSGETLTVGAVPEPSTWFSGVFCVGTLGWFFRRRAAGALKHLQAA